MAAPKAARGRGSSAQSPALIGTGYVALVSDDSDLVGVVVPAYNAERWVLTTLATVLEQTHTNWVCVVIDDGSTDATADLVQPLLADERFRLVRQANGGLPAARNAGLAALPPGCRYVAFLDSDDLWQPDTLEVLISALADRPDAVGAYGLADYVDGEGEVIEPGLHPRRQRYRRHLVGRRVRAVVGESDVTFAELVVAGPIWPPAVALQRWDAVAQTEGFDVSYTSQEDWDFYVRISRRGHYVNIDRRVALYRRHGGNMTNEHHKSVFEQERVRHNAYRSTENTPLQARQVARAWRYLQIRQSAILARSGVQSARQREWARARDYIVGAAWCLATLIHAGPPPASARRLRFTQPGHLPTAQLFSSAG